MPILHANGRCILYIHVPKTAGTSIANLLRSYGPVSGTSLHPIAGASCSPQHLHAAPLRDLFGTGNGRDASLFDYVFATVRHPIARLESEYAFQREKVGGPRYRAKQGFVGQMGPSLSTWFRLMRLRYRADPYVLDNHIRPQNEFLCFGADVFRLEDGLEPIKDKLDEITGMTGVIGGRENTTSNVRPPRWRLSANALSEARAFYAEDLRLLGYG